jgi:hypothetical protein
MRLLHDVHDRKMTLLLEGKHDYRRGTSLEEKNLPPLPVLHY